jgi:hypothetical protein
MPTQICKLIVQKLDFRTLIFKLLCIKVQFKNLCSYLEAKEFSNVNIIATPPMVSPPYRGGGI